ncbi:MAG: hypothetical protein JW910_13165 [Anaerolineae bacterium]|nr:hypothetical protein [Anaerolineae bacterium]
MSVDFNEIIQLLLPQPNRLLWDILLYLIFIFVLITMFMQPEGSLTITILMAVVVVGLFIDKVHALPNYRCSFGTLLIRVNYFASPLLTAGLTKNGRSRLPAIIAAVLGLGYMFLLWAIEMNNPCICSPLGREEYRPNCY